MLERMMEFAKRINDSRAGLRFAGAFDATVQFHWKKDPVDPTDLTWFGSPNGEWAAFEIAGGRIEVTEGDLRAGRDWRNCPLVETDETTLLAVFDGTLRPLDAYLGERLNVGHFTIGGTPGQWVLALLAFGQHPTRPLLPARAEKRFMSYPYYEGVNRRRDDLLRRIGGKPS